MQPYRLKWKMREQPALDSRLRTWWVNDPRQFHLLLTVSPSKHPSTGDQFCQCITPQTACEWEWFYIPLDVVLQVITGTSLSSQALHWYW